MSGENEELRKSEHVVASKDEIEAGERLIVLIEGREIGVFNIDGSYHAFPNWCPHMGGPLCEGPLDGTMGSSFDRDTLETTFTWGRDGEMLTCPWHGFEFDVTDGTCRSDTKFNLRQYSVRAEGDDIIIKL
jgi:nitrite reductase (NADH) small subunit